MSSRAPIGYFAIAANELATNQGFKSFVCMEGIQPEFVAWWLTWIRPLLEEMGSGSTFAEISGSRAKEVPLLVAPRAEQRRIVERIGAVLAPVNATRKRLAKAPAILKRFRQSVLAAACSGRLTEGSRCSRDAQSSEELLRSAQRIRSAAVRRPPVAPFDRAAIDAPEHWSVASLDELVVRLTSGSRAWSKYYQDDGSST
jgi:type I restriction enzyme S subunit